MKYFRWLGFVRFKVVEIVVSLDISFKVISWKYLSMYLLIVIYEKVSYSL